MRRQPEAARHRGLTPSAEGREKGFETFETFSTVEARARHFLFETLVRACAH